MIQMVSGNFARAAALTLAALIGAPLGAADLPVPEGPVVLTVTGTISKTNTEAAAEFDRAMLEALGMQSFETTTVWTEGPQVFEGPTVQALLDAVGAEGTVLRAVAVNDYAVEIPVDDELETPILALKRNGEDMPLRDKGPIWIVYPYDSDPDLRTSVIHARSIWQLERIDILR